MTKCDIIIFGATGFTGKKVVEELACGYEKYPGVTWAVAGRSESKLKSLLNDISSKTTIDLSSIKVIVADVGDYDSLKTMCSQGRVLLNCCGPYRLYGEPVVRAAIEAKTHYIDITGEEDFIAKTQMKYDNIARQAGVLVINACGFDSIPNDLGVVYLENNFEGKYTQNRGFINFGTWESAVYIFANLTEIFKLRKKLYPKALPALKPKLHQRFPFHKQNKKWAIPILSPDGSVVYHTQRRLYDTTKKRPVQFQPYLALPSISYALILGVLAIFVGILSKFKYGRDLLLNNPEWFSFGIISKQGPTQAAIDNTHFTFELIGRGWEKGQDVEASAPNKTVVAKISATDPAYGFTSLALVQSAMAILREKPQMPSVGGVLSPGAAFWNTSLVSKLKENNVKFEILK
ncbi:hypothetical protein ABMA27_001740 [Loxostege sticticalis]|uniref:Saccharopine dehydrogenase NADP binding domain-containing protein n=1 Tax=Loxostege sticticalis TaxID=481309 RepID=A0ABR3HZJ9_LOXSC